MVSTQVPVSAVRTSNSRDKNGSIYVPMLRIFIHLHFHENIGLWSIEYSHGIEHPRGERVTSIERRCELLSSCLIGKLGTYLA